MLARREATRSPLGKVPQSSKACSHGSPTMSNSPVKPWCPHSGLNPVPDLEEVSTWKQGEEGRKVHPRKQVSRYMVYLGRLERLILCRGHSYPVVLMEGLQKPLETKLLG